MAPQYPKPKYEFYLPKCFLFDKNWCPKQRSWNFVSQILNFQPLWETFCRVMLPAKMPLITYLIKKHVLIRDLTTQVSIVPVGCSKPIHQQIKQGPVVCNKTLRGLLHGQKCWARLPAEQTWFSPQGEECLMGYGKMSGLEKVGWITWIIETADGFW